MKEEEAEEREEQKKQEKQEEEEHKEHEGQSEDSRETIIACTSSRVLVVNDQQHIDEVSSSGCRFKGSSGYSRSCSSDSGVFRSSTSSARSSSPATAAVGNEQAAAVRSDAESA